MKRYFTREKPLRLKSIRLRAKARKKTPPFTGGGLMRDSFSLADDERVVATDLVGDGIEVRLDASAVCGR